MPLGLKFKKLCFLPPLGPPICPFLKKAGKGVAKLGTFMVKKAPLLPVLPVKNALIATNQVVITAPKNFKIWKALG